MRHNRYVAKNSHLVIVSDIFAGARFNARQILCLILHATIEYSLRIIISNKATGCFFVTT